jgi:tetratricopeptide (TPR) repeat protein
MPRILTSALLAITLTLGCCGVVLAQASFDHKEKADKLINRADYYDADKNYAAALEIYRFLVETQSNAIAQSNLGTMYDDGRGVAKDYKEALRLYGLSAAQGNAYAQFNLGAMYDNGRGVTEDKAEAVKWYRLAASQGSVLAQFNLGVMYDKGEGVAQDIIQSYKCLYLASRKANSIAWKRGAPTPADVRADKYKETLKLKLTPEQFIEIEKSQNRFRYNPFANEQCQ